MVKRNKYSVEYKNKIATEVCLGKPKAEVSQRENIHPTTIQKWVDNYVSGTDDGQVDKKEVIELRKKVSELSILLAEAMLQIDILKKTEKFHREQRTKEKLSAAISRSDLASKSRVKR